MTVERESEGRQHQNKGEQRRCLGTLLAHYVKHSRTKDGKERVIAKGPRCYGVSWNTSAQGRQRTKNAVTLDAVERELGKPGPGAALKLDWACAGMSSYNTRASASASSGGKVELPQCGGIEVILSNELEFVSKEESTSRSGKQQPQRQRRPRPGEGGREVAAGGKQPQYVDVNDQLKEVRNFCGNFVIVSGKIVNKMGENIGLVAEVFKALFKKT